MREAEAMRLLGATAQDDLKTIKKKFRAKMKLAHPDARAMQAVHDMSQAQKLNEAYELLKNRHSKKHTHGKHKEKESTWEDFFSFYAYDEPEWEAPEWEFTSIEHEAAYQERVVYRYEWYDSASGQYRRVTTGKYLWNPDCEEFSLLLFSLNQLAQQLLSNEEEQNNRSVSSRERDFAYTVNRQQFQLRLFHYLAVQYIQPQYALQKLAEPIRTDRQNRPLYRFEASVGEPKKGIAAYLLEQINVGDNLYPQAFRENKLYVRLQNGMEAGYISFEQDSLYYVIFPLLKNKKAQVKMQIQDVFKRSGGRGTPVYYLKVAFYLRLNKKITEEDCIQQENGVNLKIAKLLNEYKESI